MWQFGTGILSVLFSLWRSAEQEGRNPHSKALRHGNKTSHEFSVLLYLEAIHEPGCCHVCLQVRQWPPEPPVKYKQTKAAVLLINARGSKRIEKVWDVLEPPGLTEVLLVHKTKDLNTSLLFKCPNIAPKLIKHIKIRGEGSIKR